MLLKHLNLSLEVPIGTELPDATRLATDFAIEAPVVTSELELLSLFVHYCSTRRADIALALFDHLSSDFLGNRDVYSTIQDLRLDEEQARSVLKGYYSVWSLAEPHGSLCIPPTLPALFSDPNVSLMALFGGQSGTGDDVNEARWLVDVFRPLFGDYVDRMSAFLCNESRDPRFFRLYKHGMDIAMWCADAKKQPPSDYLLRSSVAIPITGLLQFMHLMILYKTLGINPGDLTKYFKVAVGHSQGTIAATLLASITDEASFYALSEKALGILMLVSAVPEVECPEADVDLKLIADSISNEGQYPSPMVSIRGICRQQLDDLIIEYNTDNVGLGSPAYLSLANTYDQFVVSGNTSSLAVFVQWMRSKCAQPGEDQTRVPFSKRKPAVKMTYLPISMPYHCELLQPVLGSQLAHAVEKGWTFDAADLTVEVRASNDGHDIRQERDLTQYLFECNCALPVDFPAAIGVSGSSHIVDFSPGGFSAFGMMAYANVEGRGIPVISTSAFAVGNSPLGIKAELFKHNIAGVIKVPNWQERFAPRLVRTAHDSRLHLDTPMHRVLGHPPLMVAGMMPTTVNEHFVAAVKNAGYHAELGGAGIYNEQMLKRKFDSLIQETAPGQSITLNCVYFNQRLWNFQYTEVLRLRRKGYPIAGVCIGAGVPSPEIANEILRSFRDVGIRHVAFKPSTAAAIRKVIQIAQTNPDFPVIIQWTGGRGGGHHSCEDFHEPLLETYSAVRSNPNIVLVLGSGFGDAEGTLPYLTGDWSIKYGRAPMPVDGFLLASRIMIAKEAGTSAAAKELIAQTSGLADDEWEKTYSGAHGGVITTLSEYGELVHVLATRGSILMKEIYETILSKPRDQQPALLNAKKDCIIQRLNADYVRPWFGRKADESVCDLEDMTYMEVVNRLVQLLYVGHQQYWIDPSYLRLLVSFLRRIEDRFSKVGLSYELQATVEVSDPAELVGAFVARYPEAMTTIISSEDIQYFISICRRPGMKPVPFIPQFDENIAVWLLKGSGWYAEEVETIIGQDVQRASVLHGPVSARYSTIVNEPVKDIMDGIYHGQIAAILESFYDGKESNIPAVGHIRSFLDTPSLPCTVPCQIFDSRRVYTLPEKESELPSLDSWVSELVGSRTDWLSALLKSNVVVNGTNYTRNDLARIIRPRPRQIVSLIIESDTALLLTISEPGKTHPEVEVSMDSDCLISVCIYHTVLDTVHPWELKFSYHPDIPSAMIHDENKDNNGQFGLIAMSGTKRSSYFFFDDESGDGIDIRPNPDHPIHFRGFTITEELVARYCSVVGNEHSYYKPHSDHSTYAPSDLLFVIGIEGVLKLISLPLGSIGFLNSVHRSNRTELAVGFDCFKVGDIINYDIYMAEMSNMAVGKYVDMHFIFYMDDIVVAKMYSAFVFRDVIIDNAIAFKYVTEPRYTFAVKSQLDIDILRTKEWLVFRDEHDCTLAPGDNLEFEIRSEYRYKNDAIYSSISSFGRVYLIRRHDQATCIPIADIDFQCCESLGNPVLEFLQRLGQQVEDDCLFNHEGIPVIPLGSNERLVVTAPATALEYAAASGDYNPIHTNQYVADYSGLPSPIIHGMWTSASTKALVERYAANCQPEHIRTYSTEFVGMVLPGDQLETKLFHVGMRNGQMIIKGETQNQHGDVVLICTAVVDQPKTVYTFAGLGSQQVGMGMGLYVQSDAARHVWDCAEKHMLSKYGVSLLNIVRNNPKQTTVNFCGKRGQVIKHTYMSLNTEVTGINCEACASRLFPQISNQSDVFVHKSASGLLNTAQFTQPALVTFAMAHIAHLKSLSLVQEQAMFAGHSLGEFGALASLTSIFSIEDIVDITFYRGLLLHASVERDNQNRSQYGMVAVNPSRVSQSFSQDSLKFIIDTIRTNGGALLELINYNVAGQQYVVTGHHTMLSALREVLDTIHSCNINISNGDGRNNIGTIIRDILAQPDRDITPKRGHSFIPLPGVDVPSHSTQLLPAVAPFRTYLLEKVPVNGVNYAELKGIYVPNVTAKPFEISKGYIESVHDVTKSPVLAYELGNWDGKGDLAHKDIGRLARLLLVELLAYQFASPVRWIETQNVLLKDNKAVRFIEISSSPTLTGMASKALKSLPSQLAQISVLHAIEDMDEVCYTYTPETEVVNGDAAQVDTPIAAVPTQQDYPDIHAPQQPAPPLPATPAQSISDSPVRTVEVLQTLIALKMKKPTSDIAVNKSIKELSGGKSTLQNEIASELQKEFGNQIPDKAEEMSLDDLATKIGMFSGTPGKQINAHLARMLATKMPGGYTQSVIRTHLENVYGLSTHRQLGVLLLALSLSPPNRLTTEAEVHEWIDGVAELYAKREGISYSVAKTTAAISSAAVINSAEFEKAQKEQQVHILRQIEVLARNAGVDLESDKRELVAIKDELGKMQSEVDSIIGEFGDDLVRGVKPTFDVRKVRHYNSYWNWVRQDLLQIVNELLLGNNGISPDRLLMLENRSHPSLVALTEGLRVAIQKKPNSRARILVDILYDISNQCEAGRLRPPVYRGFGIISQSSTEVLPTGHISYTETPNLERSTFAEYAVNMQETCSDGTPRLHMRSQLWGSSWVYDCEQTGLYFSAMGEICTHGLTFEGKTALITGCGHGSIGSDILKGLLAGGAKVIATTSSYSYKTTTYFEDIYRQYGARGSELFVFPFNQGSVGDVSSLVDHIFNVTGLNWDLDFIIPFASVSDVGKDVTLLNSASELVLRVMMTNVMRLIGAVASAKASRRLENAPSLVIVPLSPNHGTFGGDGFYGECKASLETLLNRWRSESWSDHISIIGTVIGWTRGTNIMSSNDILSSAAEGHGVRTFATNEMAFNILCLLHYNIRNLAVDSPLWADFGGGFQDVSRKMDDIIAMRTRLMERTAKLKALLAERSHESNTVMGDRMSRLWTYETSFSLAKNTLEFPRVKSYEQLGHLRYLEGIINLDKVIVVTGYGEFGPYGHAATRWEMEAYGEFSLEGCIELAWVMGLIKHHNGPLPNRTSTYIGWVDGKTEEPVHDRDIKEKYEAYILEHTGIRLLEPENTRGFDPETLPVLREIQVTQDMEPFMATAEEAENFKVVNGDKVDIRENGDGSWSVKFLKGAMVSVPKAMKFDRIAAGQLPTGWDPKRYGFPDDLIELIDPISLYNIISTIEALLRSGITDPYELYQYFHLSEVGNTTGSGLGGMHAMKDIFANYTLDKDVKTDVIQESLINTVAAWANMLLFSSAGPIKPTVGACATTALSLDVAVETIQSGKAKVMIAGASETYLREPAVGFARINATVDAVDDLSKGRTYKEMSRPCASTRSGFINSYGSGTATLMSASAAIELGAPIYGVLAMTATATDKEGRTVPAPGQGVLTVARERPVETTSLLLNVDYRRRRLERKIDAINAWAQKEKDEVQKEVECLIASAEEAPIDQEEFVRMHTDIIERKSKEMVKGAQDEWSNEFWKGDSAISPLRGSLATWGLTIDDIGVLSMHATSTVASDKNEPHVMDQQLKKLGRTPGYAVPAVCQKYLTGHSKGPSAAWMLNGVLQCMETGIIPGNRNLDNVTPELEAYDHMVFPNKPIQTPGIDAALITSFGFGQVGGEILVLNPEFAHAVLSKDALDQYCLKMEKREQKSNRYWQDVLVGNHPFAQLKDAPPFTPEQESRVYMDPTARAKYDPVSKKYHF